MSLAKKIAFGSVTLLASGIAHAAPPPFPADAAYIPLRCGGQPATDPVGDQPPFLLERDIVGDVNNPAVLRASDANFLYLRIRLDADPAPGGAVKPAAWGMAFDLDGDRTTYELLITAEGISGTAGTVGLYTNKTTTVPDSPADPADLPVAVTSKFVDAARSIQTTTMNNGTPDFFLDIGLPWTVLAPAGLKRDVPVFVWTGSSDKVNSLDGDLACFDGKGVVGATVTLDGTASDATTGDPAAGGGTGGGGGGGGGGGTGGGSGERLEGGSGCAVGGGGSGGLVGALGVLGLAFLRRRRR